MSRFDQVDNGGTTSSEMQKLAFIQKVVADVERVYKLEEQPNVQKGISDRRVVNDGVANHSPTAATNAKSTVSRSQPAVPEKLGCSHEQEAFAGLQPNAHGHRRVLQGFKTDHTDVKQESSGEASDPPDSALPDSPFSSARVENRIVAPQLSTAASGHSIASSSDVIVPRRSLNLDNVDSNSRPSAISPSQPKRPKDKLIKDSKSQTPKAANNASEKAPDPSNVKAIDKERRSKQTPSTARASRSEKKTTETVSDSTLSVEQFEEEMSKIVPTASGDRDLKLSDADFDRITLLLCQVNRKEQSKRPRTYALLRIIGAADLIDKFVSRKRFDIDLPYRRENLTRSLSSEQRSQFIKKQASVMSAKAANIEGGPQGAHANFAVNADSHLQFLNRLGKGGYGEVDRVRSKLSRKIYVRKRLKRAEATAQAVEMFRGEIKHLKQLSHRHLVRYVGSYTDPDYVGIIMEPVADMDLGKFLRESTFSRADYDCIRQAFGCLCAALVYLKDQSVRHKDIKPENILVKQRKVFLTDFGLAIDWKTHGRSTTDGPHGPISKHYAPPEVLKDEKRKTSADIWSLGCVYLDMVTVLKREILSTKTLFFMSNGTCSEFHGTNPQAFQAWMKKLDSEKDNAPLDWIKNMTLEEPDARLEPKQLMKRILSCHEHDYYGLCCDGKDEKNIAIELRDSDAETFSASEDLSDDELLPGKFKLEPTMLEKKLHSAARAQDVKMVKRWLRKASHLRNCKLNTRAIHSAARRGNKDIVEILIEFGCNMEYRSEGYTALHEAVSNAREYITELLVKTGVGIDDQTTRGLNSALHIAARHSFSRGIELLLENKALIDQQNREKETPLHIAVAKRSQHCVRILLDHHASNSINDEHGQTPLQIAAAKGLTDIARLLLDHGADVDAHLLSEKVSRTPLEMAIQNNKPKVIRLLLERGANVNLQLIFNGRTLPGPLHQAVDKQNPEIVDILMEYKPDLTLRDRSNSTPLAKACFTFTRKTKIIQSLLAAGADANVKIYGTHSLVIRVILNRDFQVAQTLVDNGGDVNLPDRNKRTVLHYAVGSNKPEVIDFLLKNRADIEAQDAAGLTPFMVAALSGRVEIMRKLNARGARVEALDRRGQTALHAAVAARSIDAVEFALELGLDPMQRSKYDDSPVSMAEQRELLKIHDLMDRALDRAGRVVCDPRWPNRRIFLPLSSLRNGYDILSFRGSPHVRDRSPSSSPRSGPALQPEPQLSQDQSMQGPDLAAIPLDTTE